MTAAVTAAVVGVAALGASAYGMSQQSSANATQAQFAQQQAALAAREGAYSPYIASTAGSQASIAGALENLGSQTYYGLQPYWNSLWNNEADLSQRYSQLAGNYGAQRDYFDQQGAWMMPKVYQEEQNQSWWEQDLGNLTQNPGSVMNTPFTQFEEQQGIQAVQRGMGSTGMNNSGNEAVALNQYGQGLASTSYQQQFDNLLKLAGYSGQQAQQYTGAAQGFFSQGLDATAGIGAAYGGMNQAFAGMSGAAAGMLDTRNAYANMLGMASSAVSAQTSAYTAAAAALGGAAGAFGGAASNMGSASTNWGNTMGSIGSMAGSAQYLAGAFGGGGYQSGYSGGGDAYAASSLQGMGYI